MVNYNKGVLLSSLHDEPLFVDCSQIQGVQGVVAEMVVRIVSGCQWVCRSSFRRTCKRHNCSQKEARQALRDSGLISRNDSFTYGCSLHPWEFRTLTFEDWLSFGYRVVKGETSYIRNVDGVALFTCLQVSKRFK